MSAVFILDYSGLFRFEVRGKLILWIGLNRTVLCCNLVILWIDVLVWIYVYVSLVFLQDGRTPLVLATQMCHPRICQLLLERGADITIRDKQNK